MSQQQLYIFGASQALGASDTAPWPEAPGLHDTNLNTLSTQTPSGLELLGHIKKEWQIKIMAVFFFIAHEKGFKFHAQPQTGAYSCSYLRVPGQFKYLQLQKMSWIFWYR